MSFRTIYGYSVSENGWRMCNADECVSVQVVPAARKVPLRRGDAATILNAWILYYHNNVEPITSQVWGWSPYNDVPNSNHLSGTAIDVNAPKYPWGAYRMSAPLIARVEDGLRKFEGTVFWGRRWSKPDEMHYQLGYREGDARIRAFAEKLNNGHLGIYGKPPAAKPKPGPEPGDTPQAPNVSDPVYPSRVDGSEHTLVDYVLNIDARTHIDHTETLPDILKRLERLEGKQ